MTFMGPYDVNVKNKTSDEILANYDSILDVPIGQYLRVAAQVRSTQELVSSQTQSTHELVGSVATLVSSLNQASKDSGTLGRKIVWLTCALVAVGVGQIMATAWPYLAWWWHH